MYLKFFLNLILLISLVIFQISFISGLPLWFSNFNFILVVLIFILVFGGLKTAIFWSLGAGFLLDIYSFLFFGFYLTSLFFTILIINFLLVNFFTDRSLYSFIALSFFSFVFYNFFLNSIIFIFSFLNDQILFFAFSKNFWSNFLIQIILNLIVVFLIFYLVNFISRRFKPVFLIKRAK